MVLVTRMRRRSSTFGSLRTCLPLTAFLGVLLASSTASAQALVISEFRNRGPNGANDEFVEIYNNSDTPHTVASAGGSTGYAVVASNGVARFVIPNGTVVPARGHYLGVNSLAYSLASYPAGSATTATGDITFTADIPDNAGIALFKTSIPASFTLANRLDAVGSTSEANTLYKEGTGYPALTPFSIDSSFYRRFPGTGTIVPGACLAALRGAAPQDTNDNAADFTFVDTNGTSAGAGQRLGAPGPQNLSSPVQTLAATATAFALLAPSAGAAAPPNVVRDNTSVPAQNSTFGTIAIRRRFTNESGVALTRLRFRVLGISTFPAPGGTADLRTRTSTSAVVALPNGGGNVTVKGTTLEVPPGQPNGGAFNSTFSASDVTGATPLGPGESIELQFLLGIQQTGKYQFFVEAEALPSTTRTVWGIIGDTESIVATDCDLQTSTTTLASSAANVLEGAAVTLTATVAAPAASTGDVTFMDGDVELAVVPLAAGKAEYTTSALAIGSHSITARYAGEGLVEPSTSTPVVIEVGARSDAPDAGSDGGDAPDAGSDGGQGTGEADAGTDAPIADDAGCGCRVGRQANVGALSLLGLGLAAGLIARRRGRGRL